MTLIEYPVVGSRVYGTDNEATAISARYIQIQLFEKTGVNILYQHAGMAQKEKDR